MSICQLAPCEREWKMWRRVVLVLLLVHIASLQPVTTDEVETPRQTRQLNFGECCPCTNNEPSFRAQDRWLNPKNLASQGNGNGGQFLNNDLGSFRSGFDDCPCRLRSADSEGSSSLFFPSALRPDALKSESKEDPKNLLEPEVGLASSVLETLRKATDEEYREALARDSARARAAEDAVPEESAQNIVTIIMPSQDDEDIVSGSHIQEPRCIRPLGSPITRMRTPLKKTPSVITEIFRLPKTKPVGLLHRHSLDMDSGIGASNIQERIVDADERNTKLKTNRILNNEEDNLCESNRRYTQNSKSVSLLDTERENSEHNNIFRNSNNPKIKLDARSNDDCNTQNTDMKSAASETKELFAEPRLKLGKLIPGKDPINLKTLLKLRDVELLQPSQLLEKLKFRSPVLQLPPLIEHIPKLSDFLKNGIKFNLNKNGQWNTANNDDDSVESGISNIQVIPRDKTVTTEILDGLPSASENIEIQDRDVDTRTFATNLKSALSDKSIESGTAKSISKSSDAIRDINVSDIDNSLRKVPEDDCHLISDIKGDPPSSELDSSEGDRDVPRGEIENQENMQSTAMEDVDQKLGASNCLETLENEEKSSENVDEVPTNNAAVLDSDELRPNLIENNPPTQEKESIILINENVSQGKTFGNQNETPLAKSLTSVRESLLRKIEERRRNGKLKSAYQTKDSNARENIQRADIGSSKEDCLNESSKIVSTLPDTLDTDSRDTKVPKASNKVEFEDLQKLSDALLKKSLVKEKLSSLNERNEFDDGNIDTNNSGASDNADKSADNKNDVINDSNTASSNQLTKIVKNPSNRNAAQEINDETDMHSKDNEGDTCTVALKDSSKALRAGPDVNEMTAEASEPVIGTQWQDPLQLLKYTRLSSPLFQDVIIQPSSLFDGIGNKAGLDLPSTLNLPTLDDIKERLANVFGLKAKSSSDEETDCMNENPIMAAEPSTSNFISRSPSLPLEDLNLDIFQLKPLTMGKSSILSKTPGLNLKSFRTKVPVPKNLDFKPLRLQSTVGNDGGLLGAALTLGRNTEDAPKLFETLGSSLQNLPSLAEMMTRVRSNVENIVSPLDLSRSSSSSPLISDLSQNLRSNAENTIRALQQRMGSSLGQTPLLSDSVRDPHELLERIADAKEDLSAKFKGLQYDFNDRLTSLHENLLDKALLPSLNPLFQDGGLSRNAYENNNQNTKFKSLSTPASKKFKLDSKKESLEKVPNTKSKQRTNSVNTPRKFKMHGAASVPVPKTVEVPKLKSMMEKSASTPENNIKIKPLTTRINPLKMENKLKSNNVRPSKLFEETSALVKKAKENKVKVTFGSTTPAPISTLRSQQRADDMTNDLGRTDNVLRRRLGLKPKSNADAQESPSEVQTIFTSALSPESINCNDDIYPLGDANDQRSVLENQRKALTPTFKQISNLRPKSATSDIPSSGTENESTRNPLSLPVPTWPKVVDNSFLSKVRDAVKARLAKFDPTSPAADTEEKSTKSCSDMERSASQNTEVVLGDSLKENISYKCRMVCTKS